MLVDNLKTNKVTELEGIAALLRKTALTMIYHAGSGHPGGSLSAADIIAVLYFNELKIDPKNPQWESRDRFILSKGHVCPIQYAALGLKGFFDKDNFKRLRRESSILQGHPDMKRCPGIDISTGSLGQGLSCGVGMAYAGKHDCIDYRVFVLLGDGETQEGQVWESISVAAKYELDNLVVIIDKNGLQNDGACEEIMPLHDLEAKFKAFGAETWHINGHDIKMLMDTIDVAGKLKNNKPKVIVCDTVKGKGVSFMENVVKWHGTAPNDEEYKQAMEELSRKVGRY